MKRRYMAVGFILIAALGVGYLAWQMRTGEWSPGVVINDTPLNAASVWLTPGTPGNDASPTGLYHVVYLDGTTKLFKPDDYARELLNQGASKTLMFKLLNISTPIGFAWVAIGLLGQILFTGRMIVQWLVSEKHKQSVVPTAFWWLSLFGASMLITYFIWRKDIVGFLGQGTGWLIYGRNLWLIYRPRKKKDA